MSKVYSLWIRTKGLRRLLLHWFCWSCDVISYAIIFIVKANAKSTSTLLIQRIWFIWTFTDICIDFYPSFCSLTLVKIYQEKPLKLRRRIYTFPTKEFLFHGTNKIIKRKHSSRMHKTYLLTVGVGGAVLYHPGGAILCHPGVLLRMPSSAKNSTPC